MFRQRWLRATALVLLLAVLGAACGGDDDDGSEAASDATPDPDGILRVALDLEALNAPIVLDPLRSRSLGDYHHLSLIYDSLLLYEPDGTIGPKLAEEFEVVDPSTVSISLRSGLTFHDGTPLDTEVVRATLERNKAAKNPNFAPALNNLQSMTVASPREMTFHLDAPIAGSFLEVLAGREAMPVPPAAVAKGPDELQTRPVGAGPYRFDAFVPHDRLSLRKYDGYWEADEWQLGGIDFIHATTAGESGGIAAVNALLAGQVDIAHIEAVQNISTVEDRGFAVDTQPSDSTFQYIGFCKDRPPFDNPDVRRAVAISIDREAINEIAFQGRGLPAYDLWPEGSPFHSEASERTYERDVDEAKSLLARAGHPNGMDLPMIFQSTNQQLAEVAQQQMSEAGFRVSLVPTVDIVTDFFRGNKTPAVFSGWIRPGVQKITRMLLPGSVANPCQYSHPTITDINNKLAALAPDDPDYGDLWEQANEFIVDNALVVPLVFEPVSFGYDPEAVGGEFAVNVPQLTPIYKDMFVPMR